MNLLILMVGLAMWEHVLVCRNHTLQYSGIREHQVCYLLSIGLGGKKKLFCKFENKFLKIIDIFAFLWITLQEFRSLTLFLSLLTLILLYLVVIISLF